MFVASGQRSAVSFQRLDLRRVKASGDIPVQSAEGNFLSLCSA
jgi:hypothetical protein